MSNDTLLREVDEELRRDRMRSAWRSGGPVVIGAAVVIVLLVAGYEGWNWYQKTTSSTASDKFYAATALADGTDFDKAKAALDDVIATTGGGYPVLAQFREASLLAKNGKVDDAVAAYDSISTNQSDQNLRGMALILAANLLVDKGDVAAVQQRVTGLLTPTNVFRNAAREAVGLTQAKAGQLDAALETLAQITADPLATNDEKGRVQIYSEQLIALGAKPKAPPADQASSSAALEASASASGPADVSASEPSTAVDASAELDVTPPPAAASTPAVTAPATPASAASAPASVAPAATASSAPASAPAVSSVAPVASSASAPPSSAAPVSSAASVGSELSASAP